MLFVHPDHSGRRVRLAYCMNFGAAEDLDGILEGLRATTLPLGRSLAPGPRAAFGVGLWLPADLALGLVAEGGEGELDRLLEFLAEHRLDAFTFNAFPWGGFHAPGQKARVFRPTWRAPERLAYTLAVAAIAIEARDEVGGADEGDGHLSISTHAGMHASDVTSSADLDACADNFALCALHLSRLESETGRRVVLSLEPEPRSIANDTGELPALFERILLRARDVLGRGRPGLRNTAEDIVLRHLGTCLDACHSAVEFEGAAASVAHATNAGATLGKVQLSNALRLERPAENHAGRERLFALDEPVFLHQLTARRRGQLDRAADLSEVRTAWESGDPPWRDGDEWRCHFHVPLDLEHVGDPASGLATTRAHAAAILATALAEPDRWGSPELHLEIETYTWNVLPPSARGRGSLREGMEREYRLALSWLARAGWTPAPPGPLSPNAG